MSSNDPFVPGATLLQYRLIDRLSSAVWRAEDTRSGKTVAVKILSRQLPRDTAKRDALLRAVRGNAALYHTSIIHIIEIAPAGDETRESPAPNKPLDRTTFSRVAYQCPDAPRRLHAKNVVDGSLNADSI